ncbi:MAG: MBL fold metallo-hydrolase [Bacillus subtilis]|nr:MBL fold metallo-hydrolase [Bacillus subtilis]
MKYLVLASGSRGNATYLEIENHRFLIDCGLSLRQIQNRLAQRNIELTRLDGIFITHEHGDHVSGIVAIANKYKPTLYMTEGTYRNLPIPAQGQSRRTKNPVRPIWKNPSKTTSVASAR